MLFFNFLWSKIGGTATANIANVIFFIENDQLSILTILPLIVSHKHGGQPLS